MLSIARLSAVALLGLSLVQALSIPMSGSVGDLPAKRSFRGNFKKARDVSSSSGAAAAVERRRAMAEKRKAKLAAKRVTKATSTTANVERSDLESRRLNFQQLMAALENDASAIFHSSFLALAAGRKRCGSSAACANVAVPDNATPTCGTSGTCTFYCDTGYAPSGENCVYTATCGTNTCVAAGNGYATCTNGVCGKGCYDGYTFVADNNGGSGACVNLQTDVYNCGTVGNACPGSYNGIGTARCSFGSCTLTCPAFQNPRATAADPNLHYCA